MEQTEHLAIDCGSWPSLYLLGNPVPLIFCYLFPDPNSISKTDPQYRGLDVLDRRFGSIAPHFCGRLRVRIHEVADKRQYSEPPRLSVEHHTLGHLRRCSRGVPWSSSGIRRKGSPASPLVHPDSYRHNACLDHHFADASDNKTADDETESKGYCNFSRCGVDASDCFREWRVSCRTITGLLRYFCSSHNVQPDCVGYKLR